MLYSKMRFILILSFAFSLCLSAGIKKVPVELLKEKDCLLPRNHWIRFNLRSLINKQNFFDSRANLAKAGFKLLNSSHQTIMVVSHPILNGYLIKKFDSTVLPEDQLRNFLMRISGARALRKFIARNGLKHIVVPRKWLYPLPATDRVIGEKSYLLIVEDMRGANFFSNPRQNEVAIEKRFKNIDDKTLKELCTIFYYFRGFDTSPRNFIVAGKKKIALIDTEHWDDWHREGFLKHIMPYLDERQQNYALKVIDELRPALHEEIKNEANEQSLPH